MSKWSDPASLDLNNLILQPKEDRLRLALTRRGFPDYLIGQYLKTNDTSFLCQHSREPEFLKEVFELMESLNTCSPLTMTGAVVKQNAREAMERTNDLFLECCRELKDHYVHCSNILKVPLLPSSKYNIHGVEDLHVPVVLKKSEISADLPRMVDLNANDLFAGRHVTRKKILLFGPPGVGKTTEIKMWLHGWCHKEAQGPLQRFRVVFYIDGAKLKPGASLGEAVKSHCLPGNSKFSREDIERMCQDSQDEVLVILDNYTKWKKKDQACETTSLEDMVLLRNFRSLTLLVASTSGGVGDFCDVYSHYDHVKVEGISEASVSTYVHKVFKQRKEFASKVEKSLQDTNQLPDMAASPLLLSFRCQIVKWNKNPEVLGDLKTGPELIDKLIDSIIKRGEDDSQIRGYSDQLESLTISQAEGNPVCSETEELSSSAVQTLRGLASATTRLGKQSNVPVKSLSKDDILEQLSVVAFHCYLRNDHPEVLYLSDDDFIVCGSLKTDVIEEGCRLGLLVKSGRDELNPTSPEAAEGKIIRFLSATIQQRLAAKHFVELLQGSDEEKQSFHTSLKKIGSIAQALSLRNLLLFACGESRDTARLIISHVVDLTRAYEQGMPQGPGQDEGVLRQAHWQYQYMIEYILDLNYEARSGGCLNDILGPLVTRLCILSPSVIMTRALSYLLENSATLKAPKLGDVHIEVYDVPSNMSKIRSDLPNHGHITYDHQEHAHVKIEDPLQASGSVQPTLRQTAMRKLSIRIEQMKAKNTRIKMAPVFPPASSLPITEDFPPFAGDSNPPSTTNQIQPLKEPGAMGGQRQRRQRREIEKISDRSDYVIGDYISFGGYGEVFKAEWKNRTVALKRMKMVEKCLTDALEREIKINALMNHPNIVVLHAYSLYQPGTTSNHCVDLIMDFIEGFTLSDAVFENKLEYLKTPRGKLTTARKVSDAVSHIHGKKCTHSDIKPDNILIRRIDNEPFVCDLGLAHGVSHSAVTTVTPGTRQGIPMWSPPESFGKGFVASSEGDVWSLACVLLEVFTRRKVWEDTSGGPDVRGEELSVAEIVSRLVGNEVTPDVISFVDNEVARNALQRCFTKTPKDRPTAKELADIFQQALAIIE